MLMRTDPFRDFDRLAQQVLGTAARPAVMPMDAWREGDRFIVEFDLPGVDEDSLDLDVERNVLTVHARRPDLDPDREMVSAERPRGVFSRQLFLGETLDADQIEASYGGGVLRLTIPVAEKAKPRRIKIASEREASDQRLTTARLTAGPGAQHPGKGVSDMATNTQWATSLLDEAAAIVEAEWMRLQQDEALWERELADLFSEMPAPRPGPARVGVTTTARRWSGQPMPDDRRPVADAAMASNAGMGDPAVSSAGPGVLLKGTVGQGR